MDTLDTKSYIATACIRKPHGVRGEMRLKSYSGEFAHLKALKTILVRSPQGRERQLEIEGFRMAFGEALIKCVGIDTPEEARLLNGWDLIVPRDQAAPLGTDEFYIADLIGLDVKNTEGTILAKLSMVFETMATDTIELTLIDTGKKILVPFVEEYVRDPDFESNTIIIEACAKGRGLSYEVYDTYSFS